MKKDILEIITKANYAEDFINYVDNNFNDYQKIYDRPYHIDLFTNPLVDNNSKERLFESLCELVDLKAFYIARGIDLEIFYITIYDLYYRIERFYNQHQKYGLAKSDLYWLGFLFRAEIFDLVSLRFQRFSLSYAEIERKDNERMEFGSENKAKFKEKTPIVNIHILNNADISPTKIDESMAMARKFFANYFPEHKYEYFFCRSWMVYPKTLALLNENSNIANFIKRFDVIASHNNPYQALNRIYGTSDLAKIKKLEHHSSLAKKAYLNLDKLGVGLGIIKR